MTRQNPTLPDTFYFFHRTNPVIITFSKRGGKSARIKCEMHLGEIGDCKVAHKRPNNRHFMPNSARIAGNSALDFGSWALIGFAFLLLPFALNMV